MIETSVARISMLQGDILRVEYKENAFVDLAEFAENLAVYKTLITTPKVYFLNIAKEGATLSPEARSAFASEERSSFKAAEAVVIKTMAQRILANFVMKLQRPKHELKFFTEEEEAMNWLMSIRKKTAEPREMF